MRDVNIIYLASDHAGYEYKEYLKKYLLDRYKGIEIVDCGAKKYDPMDDYPDFICKAAQNISKDFINSAAFIFGGSGQGEAICANRYRNVRAAVINNENIELVELAVKHNNANILSFGARFISKDFLLRAVDTYLNLKFEEEERHLRRIEKIEKMCA